MRGDQKSLEQLGSLCGPSGFQIVAASNVTDF